MVDRLDICLVGKIIITESGVCTPLFSFLVYCGSQVDSRKEAKSLYVVRSMQYAMC